MGTLSFIDKHWNIPVSSKGLERGEISGRKEGSEGKGHLKTVFAAFWEECLNQYRQKMLNWVSVDFYNQFKIHVLYFAETSQWN